MSSPARTDTRVLSTGSAKAGSPATALPPDGGREGTLPEPGRLQDELHDPGKDRGAAPAYRAGETVGRPAGGPANPARRARPTSSGTGASLHTAAFQFVPLPFVDDWLIARRRRKLVQHILESRGIRFEDKVPAILSDWVNRSMLNRVGSFSRGLITKPLRKVFRTVFFWLTVRTAVRTLAETYFLGRFVSHPDLGAVLDSDGNSDGDSEASAFLSNRRARELADLFKEVVVGIDLRLARDGYDRAWRHFRQFRRGRRSQLISTAEVERVIGEEYPGFITTFDSDVSARLLSLLKK